MANNFLKSHFRLPETKSNPSLLPKLLITQTILLNTKNEIVSYYLIAFGSMTWIQNYIVPGVVETCFISSYFACFTQHPVLRENKVSIAKIEFLSYSLKRFFLTNCYTDYRTCKLLIVSHFCKLPIVRVVRRPVAPDCCRCQRSSGKLSFLRIKFFTCTLRIIIVLCRPDNTPNSIVHWLTVHWLTLNRCKCQT